MMDRENARLVMQRIREGIISVVSIDTGIPSPFAFNLVVSAHLDLLRSEDRMEFLRRMHRMVLAKIALDRKTDRNIAEEFSYEREWGRET
jgi:ATP-dependent helicase Lhr and Lhr-like helicase